MAMNGNFEAAAIGIFCAAVLDSLDGRIARMTNSQSAFGEQMDSLCDMVGFGAAPALIVYEWALKGLGRWGWIPAFIYIAGAALRLARFNTNIGRDNGFQGSKSAAAARDGLIGSWNRRFKAGEITGGRTACASRCTRAAMVTNVPFYSVEVVGAKKPFRSRRSWRSPWLALSARTRRCPVVSSALRFRVRGLAWRDSRAGSACAISTKSPEKGCPVGGRERCYIVHVWDPYLTA